MPQIAKVWVEEGCITCDACEDIAPDIFAVQDDTSYILADVRSDGAFDTNEGAKSLLKADVGISLYDDIVDAAEGCPVDVIKFEEVADGATPAPEAPAEAPVIAPAEAEAEEGEDAVEIPAEVLEGERGLLILFGSQSGNSEDLAATTAKMAAAASLHGNVVDMAAASVADIAAASRVLIICSTWGEGEQPDNAQALWDAAEASDTDLSGVHFSVCALGDTSYDLYCQSGKDWDGRLEQMGATRVWDRVDCDVDYEPSWKSWVGPAVGSLAAVDSSGNLHQNLVSVFSELVSPAKKSGGAVAAAAGVVQPELQVTMRIFRYDPISAESGWDTYACSIPGHLSIAQALDAIRDNQDASLSYRGSGPLSGLSVNSRVVRADRCRVLDMVTGSGDALTLLIEPLPGHEVIRDLVVSTDAYEGRRSSAGLWARTADRVGANTAQGRAIGVMDAAIATELHALSGIGSNQTAQAFSDTLPHDPKYLGPAICLQLWRRSLDPRTSTKAREDAFATLEGEGGLWNEADLSTIARHGADGRALADALYSCRAELLRRGKFTGKHGRHVKWFSRTVKTFGDVNETILPAAVAGPIGMLANGRQVMRMLLGFTRTGGPIMRDKQALFLPPASIGKMPPLASLPAANHHEVVAIFNELDKRF